jgi:hypothetical protein
VTERIDPPLPSNRPVRFRIQPKNYRSPFDTPLGQEYKPQSSLSVWIGDVETAWAEASAVGFGVWAHFFLAVVVLVAYERWPDLSLAILSIGAITGSLIALLTYGKGPPLSQAKAPGSPVSYWQTTAGVVVGR